MTFIYYPFHLKCIFSCELHNRITIENKLAFEQFTLDLENCVNNGVELCYLEDDKELSFSKVAHIINSPFDLRFSKRDFQKVLFKKLLEELQANDGEQKIAEYLGGMMTELDALQTRTQYNFLYEDEVDYQAIFKMFDVCLDQPDGNFAEKLIDYISIQMDFFGRNVFFVINCNAFIQDEWYNEIIEWGKCQNVIIVFVENTQYQIGSMVNEYILDSDMCEIH